MVWKYDKARFFGTKTAPKTGDKVKVRLVDNTDPENPIEEIMTWGFDAADELNAVQFRDMVKGEVIAHLAHRNRKPQVSDVSNEFAPD